MTHQDKVRELSHGYELACANYCKYMLEMWHKKGENAYIDDDMFFFHIDGAEFRLDMDDVRDIVENEVQYEVVKAWRDAMQEENSSYYPLPVWLANRLHETGVDV